MGAFYHDHCGEVVFARFPVSIAVLSLKMSLDKITPSSLDLRIEDKKNGGKFNKLTEGTDVSPVWFCRHCNREVSVNELLADCFACSGRHRVQEMIITLHTPPVRAACYDQYRIDHSDEGLPATPKSKPLHSLLETMLIKI